ncbi:NYN domain-containing protein [Corynebacterium sp. TAE3-ERU12]|uniref:NYN domain-containing protein n=1 Tax=Corynebacterium sp. TAE3-ERU12 TaxID=2849491 RepID=UPI001C464121|nr:NYN domain-containing protein [Corynebacterium sp. TAE3-ERU12]MBV7294310.1 NYN domain-containing protein [Corynebacterium sp. TAE3-ERU12]
MLERTLVYVDTSYLLASFYNSWETGARGQLEIDLREVVRILDRMTSQQVNQPVQRQNWYDGIPESGPHRYQRQLRTLDGVRLRAGQLIEWGDRRTQKGVDTLLVADMVTAAMKGLASDIVLVSGDADMLPGVHAASDAGTRVHLYGFGWDSMSSALRYACDTTTILDPREDFAECMQLNVLEGPLPPAVPPKPIGDATPPEQLDAAPVPDTRRTPPGSETTTAEQSAEPAQQSSLSDGDSCDAGTDAAATPAPPTAPAQPEPTPAAADKPGEEPKPADTPSEISPEQVEQPSHSPRQEGTAAPVNEGEDPAETTSATADNSAAKEEKPKPGPIPGPTPGAAAGARPNPSMMAPRRKLRSRYVPFPNEVWMESGFQTPFEVGKQYANWWFDAAATETQRDEAHLLSGGGLPPEIDRPLLQFACSTLHEYTLTETQRVNLRDGFHAGIRALLLARRNPLDGRD